MTILDTQIFILTYSMKKLKLSFSSWELYHECGYKYYLKYIKWITPRVPIRYHFVTGNAFHDLVDNMYTVCSFVNSSYAISYLKRNWKKFFNYHLQKEGCTFSDTTGWEKQLGYGYGMVNKFCKWAKDNHYFVKPLCSEWKFCIPYKNFLIPGKTDVLFEREHCVEIIDFKTGRKMPSQQDVDESKQLTLYDWAVRLEKKIKKPTRVGLMFPRKGIAIHSTRTSEDHKDMLGELEKLHTNVSLSRFPPNTNSCYRCEYQDTCKYAKK